MDIWENAQGLDVAGKGNMKNLLIGIVVAKNASFQMGKPMMKNVTAKALELGNAATLDVAGKGSMKNPSLGIAAVKSVSSRMEKPMKLGVIGGMDIRDILRMGKTK